MQSKRRLVVLEMEEVNQLQKAGKDSQQIQIGNVIINSAGITEERARAVFNEMIPQALANYTEEAQKIATERVNKLEERIMPQINQVEGLLPAFADPAFQVLLRKAQQKAAITERENDYDLLTELLVCHVQKGNDRKNRAGIVKAVDIIDTIDRNPNITCNELSPNSLEYMNSKIESIIIELSRKLLLDEKNTSEEFRDNNYLMNALRNLEESMGYARQVELDLLCKMMDSYFIFTPLKDFVTKLMHIIIDLNMNMIDDEKFTNTKTEFFDTVKNYRGIPYGDKLWGLYLLSVMACDDVVEAFGGSTDANYVKNTFKEMIEHMEEILVDNQKYEYQVFDLYNYQGSYLLAQQKQNNIVSVCLYSINQIPSKRFYNINYVRKIVKVLRGSTFLRDKYTDMSIFCSKSKRSGTSCFAIMAIDDSGKKYVSISGVDIAPSSTSYLMSKLIGTSYVYVDDKEDYYLPGGYKISLKGLRDSVYLTASESKKAKTKAYKRMFSCCERKFVNYLEQGRLHELYVKYPPCYMCERMIDHEEVDKMCKIEIICPESKYYKSVVNKEYDNIAKKALNI